VRFASPFHPSGRGNQFTGDYKDFIRGLRVDGGFTGFTGFTGPGRPVRTYKEL